MCPAFAETVESEDGIPSRNYRGSRVFSKLTTLVPPLLCSKERRGREYEPVEEKKVLTQGAVSILAIFALILFVEWTTVAEEFTWFPILYEFPIEAVIVLALFAAFLIRLFRALYNWLIGAMKSANSWSSGK